MASLWKEDNSRAKRSLNYTFQYVLAAHFGLQKTYHKIRQRYFWKGMSRDIDNWVRSCQSCSQRNS